jgi:preprotein translocase subunit SecE
MFSFFRACIGEIKKITWPTLGNTTKNFGIVVLVIVVATLFIFALDMGLFKLLELVMNPGSSVIS